MDTKESLKILNRFVELGVRKGTLEKQIGLPMNCLSSVLNGKKEFPKAWEAKVEKFILESTSPPIPEPMATILVKVDEWQYLKLKEQQFGKIEEYELRISQLEDEIRVIVDNGKIDNKSDLSINYGNFTTTTSKNNDCVTIKKIDTFELPKNDNSEIEKQISAVKAEKIPKERDTSIGRRIWQRDQDEKISELRKQLKP